MDIFLVKQSRLLCEALDLVKKIQEDTALGYGTRITSKTIYLDVCRGNKRKTQLNLFLHFFSSKTFIQPKDSPFLALTFLFVFFLSTLKTKKQFNSQVLPHCQSFFLDLLLVYIWCQMKENKLRRISVEGFFFLPKY